MKNLEQLSIADLKAAIDYIREVAKDSEELCSDFPQAVSKSVSIRILKMSIQHQELEDHLQERLLAFGIEL